MKQGKQGQRHLEDALGHTGEGPGFPPSGTDTMNITLMQGAVTDFKTNVTHLQGGLK